MPLYAVTAVALDPNTGTVVAGPRVESVDTDKNELFAQCAGEWDIEDVYEAFWNRLNAEWESNFPVGQEKIKVLKVRLCTSDLTSSFRLCAGE